MTCIVLPDLRTEGSSGGGLPAIPQGDPWPGRCCARAAGKPVARRSFAAVWIADAAWRAGQPTTAC